MDMQLFALPTEEISNQVSDINVNVSNAAALSRVSASEIAPNRPEQNIVGELASLTTEEPQGTAEERSAGECPRV